MKRRILTFIAILGTLGIAHAGGPLTPPGAPAPTQKSLQEIWDKIATLETQVTTLETQNSAIRNQGLSLHYASGGSLPWTLSTVDSAGSVGYYTSLAFSPDGQPAISYLDSTNGDLKFARMGLPQP